MRTTALLILLVVLVSTGEALQCNTMDEGTEECATDVYNACVHYKTDDEEYKSCGIEEECLDTEGATVVCCTEDLCN
uniref:Plethodontid modulating factor n=1 Tax=Plethodon wehrlei TaxID=154594 RepID=Q0GAG1_9SALA|nr:plethodontid modulating factor [Plethodon wehrlei]